MLYFLPIMLFLHAQNSTDYALNYALKIAYYAQIMLIISGRSIK